MRRTTATVLVAMLGAVAVLAVAAPAGAVDDDRAAANATLTSGETYCEGQEAFFGAPAESANTTYRAVREDIGGVGEPAREIELDGNATAVVPTSGLLGNYTLRDGDGNPVLVNDSGYETGTGNASGAAWEVLDCSFRSAFVRSQVVVDDGGEQVVLSIEASDDDAVLLRSDRLNDDTLAALAGGTVTDDGARVAVEDDRVVFDFPATFACRTGDYAFTVEGNTTGAETTAGIQVTTNRETDVSLDESTLTVDRGDTATIGIRSQCEPAARVEIDGADFDAGVDLSTTRENDLVELRLGTDSAGSASATALFDPGPDATVETADINERPESDALPPGEYDLTVSGPDGRTDTGELVVRDVSTPTATPTPSPTTPTDTPTPTAAPAVTPTIGATPTPTATATDRATPSPTATAIESATPTTSRGPTGTATTGQPGFGVTVSMLALVAAALLARRP